MNRFSISTRRLGFGLSALVVSMAGALPLLTGDALAAGQVTVRSVLMSSSAPGTSTTYKVTFTPATTQATADVVVDFCSNSPIAGDSCTATAGTDVPDASSATGTNMTVVGASNKHTVKFTSVGLTSGTPASVTINAIKNPTNVGTAGNNNLGTFYARIFTYASGGGASYAPANGSAPTEGSYVDNGGAALSTASTVSITAKVMETLSFCVFKSACGDTPSLTLGHGTATKALDNTAVDSDTAGFTVSTNALSGVNIRMYGDTLKSGSNTITAAGSSPVSFAANQTGSDFGMYLSALTATTGTLNKAATYNGGSGSQYGFNTTNTTNAATGGDTIASSSGTPASVNGGAGTMTFGAIASLTTPAGVYTANEQFTATGTF